MNATRFRKPIHSVYLSMLVCGTVVVLLATGSCSEKTKEPCQPAPSQNAEITPASTGSVPVLASTAPLVTVHLATHEPTANYTPTENPQGGTIYIAPEVIVTNADIQSAEAIEATRGSTVAVTLSAEGGKKMEAFTKAHIGEMIAILVDGSLENAATIVSVVSDKIQITGKFSKEEASRLADALNP